MSALREQTEPVGIFRELARTTWAKAHEAGEAWALAAAECPAERIPSPADLAAWTADDATEAARTEAAERLTALVLPDWQDARGRGAGAVIGPTHRLGDPAPTGPVHVVSDRVDMAETQRYLLVTALTRPSMATVDAPSLDLYGRLVTDAHRRWTGGPHPLAPMVADWQRWAPVPVEVDRHVRAIMPASLRDAVRDHETLPLALDRTTPLGPIGEPDQGYLPGLEPTPSGVPPVPWLTLYDMAGTGPMQTRGRGAPLAQRLFVEVLTAVHVGVRDPEWSTAPPITLRDLFTWCWPRYFDRQKWNKQTRQWGALRGGYDRSKHLEPLRRALIELDNMRILYDRYERRLIRVDDLPTAATALDDPILFHVRHLPGSERGPMLDRVTARRWGVVSAPAWRGTIRLAYLWDEAKGRNYGARVYATRPVVARGPGGAVLGANGKPLRNRRGAVVADWSDRRAVVLGANGKPAGDGNPPAFERNPAADRVPVLGPDDLIRLTYDEHVDLPASTRRSRLHEAREAIQAKADAGEVVIEVDGDGWRIVEARPGRTAPTDPDTCGR